MVSTLYELKGLHIKRMVVCVFFKLTWSDERWVYLQVRLHDTSKCNFLSTLLQLVNTHPFSLSLPKEKSPTYFL